MYLQSIIRFVSVPVSLRYRLQDFVLFNFSLFQHSSVPRILKERKILLIYIHFTTVACLNFRVMESNSMMYHNTFYRLLLLPLFLLSESADLTSQLNT